MRVLLFGASGMVGHGVLHACLQDARVTQVTVVGRRSLGRAHPKLREIVKPDLADWRTDADSLAGYDACFFPLGVSAAGLSETVYTHITHDLTLAVADALLVAARRAGTPAPVFVYVSGQGTDSTEQGRTMWARVKGRTENALLARGFRAAFMFRPGIIQPVDGARSSTAWYRVLYQVLGPAIPLLRRVFPDQIVTSTELGRAMIAVTVQALQTTGREATAAAGGILEPRDIARAARAA